MSYANNDHYKWVESATKQTCSPLGREVANIIGYVGRGIYNAPINKKIDWTDTYAIEILWRHDMANWDFCQLTQLVIECHRRMIRVSISPCNFQYIKLQFHKRETRDRREGMSNCLPDIETMIAMQDEDWGRNECTCNMGYDPSCRWTGHNNEPK